MKRNDESLILRRLSSLSTKRREGALVPRTHFSVLVLVCAHPRISATCPGSRCHRSLVRGHPPTIPVGAHHAGTSSPGCVIISRDFELSGTGE